jgi:hypothetical protein
MTPVTRIIPGTFSLRIGTTTYVEMSTTRLIMKQDNYSLNADLAIDVMANYVQMVEDGV